MSRVEQIMTAAPVIPVVVCRSVSEGVSLARALVKGGLPSIEVTLRSNAAIDAIRAIAEEVEGALVGAGTVLNAGQAEAVVEAGATFMVSPGVTDKLLDAVDAMDVPLLPGAGTASEIMRLGERGYTHLKFFPAEQSGGAAFLKSVSGPLPDYRFCPTGGVSLDNASDYLSLSNVICVGGSWVAPKDMVDAQDWAGIEALAADACARFGRLEA